ncbi:hypothetical protein HII36_02825 [Nonomuraea sp. NN258]|uniref:hypothetical protein n=1 Tax=Nonomuraea antri TaxID=2730852 RepID=UPI0015687ED6|nr:hypothetical protein [Nonomuraea antri]NRQ30773.1 hypothetical protein [Nonomuraea antri]
MLALGGLLDLDAPAPPPADVAARVRARLESPDEAPGEASSEAPDESPDEAPDETPGEAPDEVSGGAPVRRHRPAGRPTRPGWSRRTRWKVVTAVVLAIVAVTAATPQGRAAVARILRFAGIELQVGETTPPPVTTTAPLPGERTVPPSDLGGRAKFPVRTITALGPPEKTTVADAGRVVSMFWPGGIRLDQFDGGVSPFFFKKLGPPGPEYVQVGGRQAWWVPGEHPLGYLWREDGSVLPLRQAEPTLIWQRDTVGFRLEGAGSRERAIELAESLR